MLFKILTTLILTIARFFALDQIWCDAAEATAMRAAQEPIPFFVREAVHDVAVVERDVIVVTGLAPERQLVRSSGRREDETLVTATQKGSLGGDWLMADEHRWWYGTMGEHDGCIDTTFVRDDGEGDGEIETSAVPAAGSPPYIWLPLKGDKPRALQLSFGDTGNLLLTEIDPTGALRSWHLPWRSHVTHAQSAERLPDGRIAYVTHQNGGDRLMLVLLGDNERADIVMLGYAMTVQLATAVDSAGRLAIVSSMKDRRILGTVIDPDHPVPLTWHELGTEARLTGNMRELQVIATSDGFVAAWLSRGGEERSQLLARELKTNRAGIAAIGIGEPLDRNREIFFSLRGEGGEPVFYWDDGRQLVRRRLPVSLAGYDFVQGLASLFCNVHH